MRHALPLILTIFCSGYLSAQALVEPLKPASEGLFLETHRQAAELLLSAGEEAPQEPILLDPTPNPLQPLQIPGEKIGSIKLADLLDRHRDMLVRPLGAWTWAIGPAGDPGFKNFYLTFLKPDAFTIAPLGDLNRLRGDGINITIVPGTTYNFKVAINIFNPVRGSTLKITPVSGTSGPKHEMKTGVVLDAIKAKSFIFNANNKEYWMLLGTDVDPATNALAKTKSFLIINEAGVKSKAWPLAEASLEPGKPVHVDLEGTQLVLIKSPEGELSVHSPR